MKRLLVVSLFLCVCSGCILIPQSWRVSRGEKAIAIVSVGLANEDMINRVSEFVGQNYSCQVRIKPHQVALKKSPEKQAKTLGKIMGRDDICLLALINIPEDVKFRRAIFKSRNVAMLNIWALRPKKIDSKKAAEQYARRVEKESMCAIGMLIGLKVCPMPRCAMSAYRNDKQLDAKGRNLCPPCHGKALKILKAKGVKLKFE